MLLYKGISLSKPKQNWSTERVAPRLTLSRNISFCSSLYNTLFLLLWNSRVLELFPVDFLRNNCFFRVLLGNLPPPPPPPIWRHKLYYEWKASCMLVSARARSGATLDNHGCFYSWVANQIVIWVFWACLIFWINLQRNALHFVLTWDSAQG